MSVQNTEEIIDAEMRKVFLNKRSIIKQHIKAERQIVLISHS